MCGEFVSPEVLNNFEVILGPGHTVFEAAPQINRARLFLGSEVVTLPFSSPGRSIPRDILDCALATAATNAGVDLRYETVALNIKRKQSFLLETTAGAFTAKAVINATGRWSQIGSRRHYLPESQKHRWIGLKAYFAEQTRAVDRGSTDLYFFDSGYCGVQEVSEGVVNVAALVRSGSATSLDSVFSLHPELEKRSRNWRRLFSDLATAPVFFAPIQPTTEGYLNAGDAAGFIDPFAGDGIALAMRSGVLAASSLLPAIAGRETVEVAAQRYSRQYRAHFSSIYRNAAILRRALMLPNAVRLPFVTALRHPSIAELAVRLTRG